jgi:23S rRNA (uracil-5-)-methyltransferase RumA
METLKKGQILEVVIEKVVPSLKGFLTHSSGKKIFVLGALPGEKLKVKITKNKKDYAEAKIVEYLKHNADYVKPKCKQAEVCGGCSWQHLEYQKQVFLKYQVLQETLKEIINKDLVLPVLETKEYAYRNKIELSFGYETMLREKKENGEIVYYDKNPSLGFHPPLKWETILDFDHCYLVTKNLNQVIKILKTLIDKYTVFNPKIRKGVLRQVLLKEHQGKVLINLVVSQKIDDLFLKDLVEKLKEFNLVSFYYTILDPEISDFKRGEMILFWGEKTVKEELLGLKFELSPSSFFQTNTLGAKILFQEVLKLIDENIEVLFDLYCGTGVIGQIIAKNKPNLEVIGVEIIKEAVLDAEKNLKLNNLTNIKYFPLKVEDVILKFLPDYLHKKKIILVDPPRSGLHKKALKGILEFKAEKIIYVSCNPDTFKRDAEILIKNNYCLKIVKPVDMFPQTVKLELVAEFVLD